MARNDQLSRTLKVLRYLELNPRGLSVRAILDKLEEDKISTSRDSVYRDLKGLSSSGFPIIKDGEGDKSVWKLDSNLKLDRAIVFNYNELIALYLARETLRSLEHSSIYEVIEEAFKKIELALGPKAHEAMKSLYQTIRVDSSPAWMGSVSREIIDTVHNATCEGHFLQLDYRSVSGGNAGVTTTRKIGPYKIWFADSGAYLLGLDLADNVVKRFALTRISRAVMLDEVFSDHAINEEEHFAQAIGVFSDGQTEEVELFIEEPIASYVADRMIHKSQRIVRKENGIVLTMNVKVNDELARWVLSLGASAQVVRPSRLAVKVLRSAEQIISKLKASKVVNE